MGKAKESDALSEFGFMPKSKNELELLESELTKRVQDLIEIFESLGLIIVNTESVAVDGELSRSFVNEAFIYYFIDEAELLLPAEDRSRNAMYGYRPTAYTFLAMQKVLDGKSVTDSGIPNVTFSSPRTLAYALQGAQVIELFLRLPVAEQLIENFSQTRSPAEVNRRRLQRHHLA